MRYSTQIKPISYLKANAAEILRELAETRAPLIVTQNGEAKAVLVDVVRYQETEETLAMLKLFAMGQREINEDRVKPVRDVLARLKAKTFDSDA